MNEKEFNFMISYHYSLTLPSCTKWCVSACIHAYDNQRIL